MNFNTIKEYSHITIIADKAQENNRLDRFLTDYFPRYSRNFFKKIIEDGGIAINGDTTRKASYTLHSWDEVVLSFRRLVVPGSRRVIPDDMGVRIVYTHPEFMIIYKPPGLLVHAPNVHSTSLTLCDWLTHQYDELKTVGFADRPGIVHRLDKDTSGLMIIPRTCHAHATFSDLFRLRKIEKTYIAVVHGHPEKAGTVDFNITRHPVVKTKMTHSTTTGRQSLTHYVVKNYFKDTSLLELKPVTGRTHQIRVHCTALGHPIVGDTVYGNGGKKTPIARQALHAYKLSFSFQGRLYAFMYDIPQDIKTLVSYLA